MTKVLAIRREDGSMEFMVAGANVDLVCLAVGARGRISVSREEVKGMPQEAFFEAVCDHLSHEIQTGQLDLVKLNNALE